ncbi:autotransporter adhesin [Paraburkholderia sp. GAS199]|uniref:YadA-like family protein n=1 Tax=Paraburkholderia sp. GAS199 TaxID=3035126 RepID=UPI003D1E7972
MNRIYKSVWNDTTGTWVATSEVARAKTKRGSGGKLVVAQVVMAGAALLGGVSAHAQYFEANGPEFAQASGPWAVAAGSGANAAEAGSVAIGADSKAAEVSTTAVGGFAQAIGSDSTALGGGATALGAGSTAVGVGAAASGDGALAVGYIGTSATAPDAVAIGHNAVASAANSVALGANSTTTASKADLEAPGYMPAGADTSLLAGTRALGEVSVGSDGAERRVTNVAAGLAGTDAVNVNQLKAVADSGTQHYFKATGSTPGTDDAYVAAQSWAVAAGPSATATGLASVAIGWSAMATNVSATAVGSLANASNDSATALGGGATASGASSTAIGAGAVATAERSVALGTSSTTSANLKADAYLLNSPNGSMIAGTDPVGEVSIGSDKAERRLTNVAAGSADTDAVNVSQLKALDSNIAAVADSGTQHYFKATGSTPGTDDAYAAAQSWAVAAGPSATATGLASVAIGWSAMATDVSATAVGSLANASNDSATALGGGATASGASSTAIGAGAVATSERSVALGTSSTTSANLKADAYLLNSPNGSMIAGTSPVGEVSIGSLGQERRLTNVAAGSADTDAVNVSQLKAVEAQTSATAAKVDGAVTYDTANGSVDKNNVTLGGDGGTVIHNVADGVALTDAVNLGQLNAAVNGAVNNAIGTAADPFVAADGNRDTEAAQATGTHSFAAGASAVASGANSAAVGANSMASGSNATAIGAGANASADNAVALGQGSVADRANTVSVGAVGSERQITNVAAGVQGTDAVNVNQLQQSMSGAVGQANSYTDDQIRSARRDSYGGTASALAVAGLPQAVLPGHGMVAMAGGTYGGQSAVAIGVSQLSETGKWVYKVQGTSDSRGQFGASIGAGMHW